MTFDQNNKEMMELVEEAMFFGKTGTMSKQKMIKTLSKKTIDWAHEMHEELWERLSLEGNGIDNLQLNDLNEKIPVLQLVIHSDGEWEIYSGRDQVLAEGKNYANGELEKTWMSFLIRKYNNFI
jgi:hypothetical protein